MKTVKTFLERSGVLQKKSMQISADITETLISYAWICLFLKQELIKASQAYHI